uniref:Cadherin domain-containing protein n=1 Tax=Biomphalaria glabrata TaxID=6526 RepID=A0A2C9M654_BIOGL
MDTPPKNNLPSYPVSSTVYCLYSDLDQGIMDYGPSLNLTETCPGLFEITPASGEVRLKSVPDRDKGIVHDNNGICTLTVEAKEGQRYPQSIPGRDVRTEEVTITIEDVDDNEPQFNSKSYDAIVAENTPNGVPIILSSTMRVEDIDQVNLVFGTCLKKN